VTSSKDWEKKLEGMSRLWKSFMQRQQQLDEWLDTAATVLQDKEDDCESLIRKHKVRGLKIIIMIKWTFSYTRF
jgi:hypothetical protein